MRVHSRAGLTQWASAAGSLWLFLDYDGTLADFAPTPDHIEPEPHVIRLLEQLARRPGLRLTVLSGRRLGHIRQLLPIKGMFLAGTYGIEILNPDGETVSRLEYAAIRPALEAIEPQWEQLVAGRRGFFLEDKGWTLALHARFADEEEAERVMVQAMQALEQQPLGDRFRILGGHRFLEIAPRLASKREAVVYLLDQYPFPDAGLLYIGDDDKDEEAFPVIQAGGGIAVKVLQPSQRARPTRADLFFESPAETRRWLELLLVARPSLDSGAM